MALFGVELFAQFVYSPDLSYHDLLAKEDALKVSLTAALEERQGEFAHFEALGDTLRAQCVCPAYSKELFQSLCDAVAAELGNDVEGRLLFVHKDLASLHTYAICRGQWTESVLVLPAAGPFGAAVRRAAREEDLAERLNKLGNAASNPPTGD